MQIRFFAGLKKVILQDYVDVQTYSFLIDVVFQSPESRRWDDFGHTRWGNVCDAAGYPWSVIQLTRSWYYVNSDNFLCYFASLWNIVLVGKIFYMKEKPFDFGCEV